MSFVGYFFFKKKTLAVKNFRYERIESPENKSHIRQRTVPLLGPLFVDGPLFCGRDLVVSAFIMVLLAVSSAQRACLTLAN